MQGNLGEALLLQVCNDGLPAGEWETDHVSSTRRENTGEKNLLRGESSGQLSSKKLDVPGRYDTLTVKGAFSSRMGAVRATLQSCAEVFKKRHSARAASQQQESSLPWRGGGSPAQDVAADHGQHLVELALHQCQLEHVLSRVHLDALSRFSPCFGVPQLSAVNSSSTTGREIIPLRELITVRITGTVASTADNGSC